MGLYSCLSACCMCEQAPMHVTYQSVRCRVLARRRTAAIKLPSLFTGVFGAVKSGWPDGILPCRIKLFIWCEHDLLENVHSVLDFIGVVWKKGQDGQCNRIIERPCHKPHYACCYPAYSGMWFLKKVLHIESGKESVLVASKGER
jgi:hypothetical protein